MSPFAPVPGRPEEGEYSPWAGGYVTLVEGDDILTILARQTPDYLTLVRSLDPDYACAPGNWTVKQIAGHVTDAERILAYRLLCIARGDQTPFPGFEQDDYVATAGFAARTFDGILEEFEAVRAATAALIRGLPGDSWLRRGTVAGYSVTPRGLAFQLAGHERHHARVLRERYRQG